MYGQVRFLPALRRAQEHKAKARRDQPRQNCERENVQTSLEAMGDVTSCTAKVVVSNALRHVPLLAKMAYSRPIALACGTLASTGMESRKVCGVLFYTGYE